MLITQLAIALPTSFSFAIRLQCSISGAAIILSCIWASVMPLYYSLTPKYVATNCCSTASSSHVGWENAGDDTARTATANPNIVRTVLPCSYALLAIDIGVASRAAVANYGVGVQHSILPEMAYPVRGLRPISQCTAKTHGMAAYGRFCLKKSVPAKITTFFGALVRSSRIRVGATRVVPRDVTRWSEGDIYLVTLAVPNQAVGCTTNHSPRRYSNANMRFQSFFMLITVQPPFFASS